MASKIVITCDICNKEVADNDHHLLFFPPTRKVAILLEGTDLDEIPSGDKLQELGWAIQDVHLNCGVKKIRELLDVPQLAEPTPTPLVLTLGGNVG